MTESNFIATLDDLDDVLAPRNWFKSTGNKLFSSGANARGQLSLQDTNPRCVFTQENATIGSWCSVSAGSGHASGLKNNGTIWSWGCNAGGQLGDNRTTNAAYQRQESSSSTNWCMTRSGGYNTGAIKSDGSLWTWGCGLCFALGRGNLTSNSCSPVREFCSATDWCLMDFSSSASGSAIKQDGSLWSWGLNSCGKLGDGSTVNRSVPTREFTCSTSWCAVSLATFHSVGLKSDGSLWAWGFGGQGSLGDGDTTNKCSPVQEITCSLDWRSVAAGCALTTQAIKTDNSLWIWGCTQLSALGTKCSPVQEITSSYDWYRHSVTEVASMAVKTNGTLWGWGLNTCGILGNGSTSSVDTPTQVSIDTTWRDVDLGSNSSHALKMSDTLCG